MDTKSNEQKWVHTGAILAGGQSKRMGTLKQNVLLWDNKPMLEHVINHLSKVCRNIVIVGDKKDIEADIKLFNNVTFLPDKNPGYGPLIGVETLLSSGIDNEYLIIACDQPLLTSELLFELTNDPSSASIKLFTYKDFKDINPFPGYYSVKLLDHVRTSIKTGLTAMHEMIENCKDIRWVQLTKEEANLFKNINTPEDLKKIKSEQI